MVVVAAFCWTDLWVGTAFFQKMLYPPLATRKIIRVKANPKPSTYALFYVPILLLVFRTSSVLVLVPVSTSL